MYNYALLDEGNICISVIQYGQVLDIPPPNYLVIDSFNESLVGKKWNGTSWEEVIVVETAESAREWRDGELFTTDWIVPVTDHPAHAAYLVYRQTLRDWPSTPSFPDTKPVSP